MDLVVLWKLLTLNSQPLHPKMQPAALLCKGDAMHRIWAETQSALCSLPKTITIIQTVTSESCNLSSRSILLLRDRVSVFSILTILLCLSLFIGLGDGWGQTTRFNPLDSMAKELGSHLLQVSTEHNIILYMNCCFKYIRLLYVTVLS